MTLVRVCVQVRIKVPGVWFEGDMTPAEKAKKYTAVAVEYIKERSFTVEGGRTQRREKAEAIRFQIVEDVAVQPSHTGMCNGI